MCSRLRKVHDERLAPPTQQQPLMEEDPASAQVFDGPLAPSPTWHEHFSIPELPVQLSRAGLYIYINAAVGGDRLLGVRDFLLTLCSWSARHSSTTWCCLPTSTTAMG
jgi:hypothetical protein